MSQPPLKETAILAPCRNLTAATHAATTVRLLNPVEMPDWDELVTSHPDHTIFHTAGWARVLQETYGYEPAYFTCTANQQLLGLLAVFEVKGWFNGSRGISLPFSDTCRPIARDAQHWNALREAVERHALQRKWRYFELRGGWDSAADSDSSASYYGHSLGLREGPDHLWSSLDSSVRRAVRKSEHAGVQVEWSQTQEGIETYYRLHCQTRRGHGLPPQPFIFFRKLQEILLATGKGQIAIARHGAVPIGGAVFLNSGKKVLYKFGASDAASQHLRGNNLIMWKAIEHYSNRGFDVLDFGRTDLGNEGLRRFKLGWGAVEQRLHYHRYDLRLRSFVSCPDRTVGWHNRVFRNLPVPLARAIGSVLYRHLP